MCLCCFIPLFKELAIPVTILEPEPLLGTFRMRFVVVNVVVLRSGGGAYIVLRSGGGAYVVLRSGAGLMKY